MKNAKLFYGLGMTLLLGLSALTGCNKSTGEDTYDEKGRLILDLKNVYFDTWTGEETYTEMINDKFNVKINATNYEYSQWDEAVNTSINGNTLKDTIQFNLKAYNFGSTYEKWAEDMIIKPLPNNLNKWPNLKNEIDNISNVESLKIKDKLYGIPVANDISNPGKDFSNFTYVYRRDWAKKIDEMNAGKPDYVPVYREGDVYTWDEFVRLARAFATNIATLSETDKACALVDEAWGFPSVTNFFKDAPHCYGKDADGNAINNFTSPNYLRGLEAAKQFVSEKIYSQDQFGFVDGKANELYLGGQAAILYDNYSLSNYLKLRKGFKKNQKTVNLDDGTALLKVKGPDGKFALEGTENWFSMTMFNYDISDNKMNKILDILDYLLSDEGTRLAIYGQEGYDYEIVTGDDYDYICNGTKVKLSPQGWEKGSDGQYGPKPNGAKYLRYMATLGNDTKPFDPYTDVETFNILNNWTNEMKAAKAAGNLRVVQEPGDISWMSTETKNDKTESNLYDANTAVLKYCFGKLADIDAYLAEFDKIPSWARILDEINQKQSSKRGCKGSILVTGSIFAMLSVGAVAVFLVRGKRKELDIE